MSERAGTAPLSALIRASNSSQKNSRSLSKNNSTSLASSLSKDVVRTCEVQNLEEYDKYGGMHFGFVLAAQDLITDIEVKTVFHHLK
jgi:hypothetical protein